MVKIDDSDGSSYTGFHKGVGSKGATERKLKLRPGDIDNGYNHASLFLVLLFLLDLLS